MTSDAAYLHRRKTFKMQKLVDKLQEAVYAGTSSKDILKEFSTQLKEYDLDGNKLIDRFTKAKIASRSTSVSVGVTQVRPAGIPDKSGK